MHKIALIFRYVLLCSQNENDTVQDALILISMPDYDIAIYASLLLLSFENNKNKINASNNYKEWLKIPVKSITQT